MEGPSHHIYQEVEVSLNHQSSVSNCSFTFLGYNCNQGLLYHFISESRFCENYKDGEQTVPPFHVFIISIGRATSS